MITPPNGFSVDTLFYEPEPLYDLCELNGSKFAIFSKPINSDQEISLDFRNSNIVLLSPLEAETNITIKAISVIILANINSKKGAITILSKGKLINLGNTIFSMQKNLVSGDKGVIATFITTEKRETIKNTFNEAILKTDSKLVVDALCQTYDACEDPYDDNSEGFDIDQVFDFFDIPLSNLNSAASTSGSSESSSES